MTDYFTDYLQKQQAAQAAIPVAKVADWAERLRQCRTDDQQIFVFGNGGSGTNASHFVTDLGKSASDRLAQNDPGKRFRVLSLNENMAWLTALGNDYAYENVFAGQLQNYARPGDLVLTMSVSGNSPNLVKAVRWANDHGLTTLAMVGGKRGQLADLAHDVIVIPDEHYGRVEDAQMTICHLLCYCFIERAKE
jgi:D-sedoheptulose 7-phosphate isomerase